MASYLITGSSRGIGYGLIRMLASKPASQVGTVIASARSASPNSELKELIAANQGRVHFVSMDTASSPESIETSAKEVEKILGSKGLDVLINNVGIHGTHGMLDGNITGADLTSTFAVNVGGTHNVTKTFLPLLKKGQQKKIINVSTPLGSIGRAKDYADLAIVPCYKVSKAAMNMLSVQWAQFLAADGFIVFAISPGWVKTALASPEEHKVADFADLTLEESTDAIWEMITNATKEQNGQFQEVRIEGWQNKKFRYPYDGGIVPW